MNEPAGHGDCPPDPPHGLDDVLAALLDIVFRPDGNRLDLALRANNMLKRGAKLNGQPSVGHEDNADHVRLPCAPALRRTKGPWSS